MEFNFADWTKLIINSVDRVSDKSYQDRSWFGGSKEISSPNEMFCELFDDLDFESYLESGNVALTSTQRSSGEILKEKMNNYLVPTGDFLDPRKVIDDPAWHEIRAAASDFVSAMKASEVVSQTLPVDDN